MNYKSQRDSTGANRTHHVVGAELSGHQVAHDVMRQQWAASGHANTESIVATSWLLVTAQKLMVCLEDLLRPLGLNFTRFQALAVLFWSKNSSLGLARMSHRVGVHPTTMTYAVDQLERDGLVKRIPHPADRRRKLAALTPAGRALIERAFVALDSGWYSRGALSEAELRDVSECMQRFMAGLEAAFGSVVKED